MAVTRYSELSTWSSWLWDAAVEHREAVEEFETANREVGKVLKGLGLNA